MPKFIMTIQDAYLSEEVHKICLGLQQTLSPENTTRVGLQAIAEALASCTLLKRYIYWPEPKKQGTSILYLMTQEEYKEVAKEQGELEALTKRHEEERKTANASFMSKCFGLTP